MRPRRSRMVGIALLTAVILSTGATAVSQVGSAAGPVTFVWGVAGDAETLDSSVGLSFFTAEIAWQVFDTLVRLKPGTIAVEPDLATSWSVSPDGLVYTFKLRKGATFQDGTPWNAEAAKFNIDRWADATNPYRPKTGEFTYWRGLVADAFQEALVVDPYTLQLRLKTPSAPMLSNLAIFAFGFASPAALRQYGGDGASQHPVGTGPYRFVEWVRDDHITLEANPSFFRVGLPKVQRIIYRVIKDNSGRFLALKAREIHAMASANPDDMKLAQADPNMKIALGAAFNTGWVHFNMANQYFSDKRIREAVALAINKQAIVEGLYGGLGEVADQFMPPLMWGRSPTVKAYPYDPERAKKLLAEAGYANGFSTEFWYIPVSRSYFPSGKEIGSAIANDLTKIGIKTSLMTEDWATYLKDRRTLKFPLHMIGWAGDTGDPDNWLGFVFGGHDQNRASLSYDSPIVRSLVGKARGLTSQAERAKLYAQIQEIIYKDIPIVPIAHSKTLLLMQSNVDGLNALGIGEIRMETVSLR